MTQIDSSQDVAVKLPAAQPEQGDLLTAATRSTVALAGLADDEEDEAKDRGSDSAA